MWGDSGDEGEKDAGEDVGEPGKGEWTCSTCTLLNPQSLSACQVKFSHTLGTHAKYTAVAAAPLQPAQRRA
jgi:hypothetical protein